MSASQYYCFKTKPHQPRLLSHLNKIQTCHPACVIACVRSEFIFRVLFSLLHKSRPTAGCTINMAPRTEFREPQPWKTPNVCGLLVFFWNSVLPVHMSPRLGVLRLGVGGGGTDGCVEVKQSSVTGGRNATAESVELRMTPSFFYRLLSPDICFSPERRASIPSPFH